jgi:glycosyltransferase involved in cell wall biosynthesis
MSERNTSPVKHITLFLHSLAGGGGTRVMLNLAEAFLARGIKVDLVVAGKLRGLNAQSIPAGARLIGLKRSFRSRSGLIALKADRKGAKFMSLPVLLPLSPPRAFFYLPDLTRYLRQECPDALIAEGKYCNLTALWARRAARVPTRIIISEHIALSARLANPDNRRQWKWRYAVPLYKRMYPWADAIVSVSNGVGDDLAELIGLPRESITTIYNPIINDSIFKKAEEPVDHPWFQPGSPPVILGVGRIIPRKDFPTLLRAFARVRSKREARLVILGDKKDEADYLALKSLARELGVEQDFDMPGYADNPFAYMARSAVMVLSSKWEGFGNVIVEAMACGCPVASTDCPYGPAEILDNGRYGKLVPVGDDVAMAKAIITMLDNRSQDGQLRHRATKFSIDSACEAYLDIFNSRLGL